MPQEDFLKRQVDELGRALARLLARCTGADLDVPTMETERIWQEDQGLKLSQVYAMDKQELKDFLHAKPEFTAENIELLADVYVAWSKSKAPGLDEARQMQMLAIELYRQADVKSGSYSLQRQDKIRELTLNEEKAIS